MPTFDTPRPVSATISILIGDVRIRATDRTDTVVEVRPADESSKADLKIVEQTLVEYADGRLLVRTPKHFSSWFGRSGRVDVDVALPSGSSLHGETGMGELRCDGPLGDCTFKSGMGPFTLEQTGSLHVTTGAGDITVDRVDGDARVNTGIGTVRIGLVDGTGTVKNSSGETWLGEVTGDLRISAANGDITVDRARASVTAKTAFGTVRIGEVIRGTTVLESAAGDLEVGVRTGTAVWLDVNTSAGLVRNHLNAADGPGQAEETVEVRARTHVGDIIVTRT